MVKIKERCSSKGMREAHIIIEVENSRLPFQGQLEGVMSEYKKYCNNHPAFTPVLERWFLSDAANQLTFLPEQRCARSVVEQAPLNLTKVALWVWLIEGAEVQETEEKGIYELRRENYSHIFEAGSNRSGLGPYAATYDMLSSAELRLRDRGGSLIENCVRTWFFVQNVDVNYSGVVNGRNSAFEEFGLTPDTRFIASTGIGGRHADKGVAVQMDSYSVRGIKAEQMRQLNAPEYLNPTSEYGVAFERACSVDYGDRRHLFISGTASIDNKGEVVWEGNIRRQTLRMWENVEALLETADCAWQDVMQILVYLRDPADYGVVKMMFEEKFPDIPFVILLAPVCRPGWLIEMECMAMKAIESEYADF